MFSWLSNAIDTISLDAYQGLRGLFNIQSLTPEEIKIKANQAAQIKQKQDEEKKKQTETSNHVKESLAQYVDEYNLGYIFGGIVAFLVIIKVLKKGKLKNGWSTVRKYR